MHRLRLSACALVLAAASAGAEPLRVAVELAEGHATVEVDAGEGPPGWAAYYRAIIARYLQAMERYLGVPFHPAAAPYLAHSGGAPTIRLIGRSEVVLDGQRVGGVNNSAGLFDTERAILVEYGLAEVGSPALVLHELGHFFYDLPGAQSAWVTEGGASFLPLAMTAAGYLPLSVEERDSIALHWGPAAHHRRRGSTWPSSATSASPTPTASPSGTTRPSRRSSSCTRSLARRATAAFCARSSPTAPLT